MLQVGDIIEGQIEALGSRGEGIFRLEGLSIFVPKTSEGDRVKVELLSVKARQAHAKLVEVISRGPEYRQPRCKHYFECGGCDFQHLDYEKQLRWKEKTTLHWLERSPLKPFIEDLQFDRIASDSEWNYRHRARMVVKNERPAFRRPRSNDLLFIEECPVLVEGFLDAVLQASQNIKEANELSLLYLDGQLQEEAAYVLGSHSIRIHRRGFSQANLGVNRKMWERIQEDLHGLAKKNIAVDLFCGSGNFTLGLKDHFAKVIGVESNPLSIELAKKTSSEIEWIQAEVEEMIDEVISQSPDFVLLDPSREGAKFVADRLARSSVPAIAYVSCQLDTLIRDLTSMVKKGNYRIERWTMVDLMPQTKHIESIVSLELRSN